MNSPVEVSRWRAFSRLRDAEVGDLGLARGQHDHVGRLDVAVHDAARVGEAERARDLGDDAHHARPLHLPLARELRERLAAQQLECYEQRAARLVAPDVVDHDDPGMLELGGDARLREEALLVGLELVPLRRRLDDLQGHRAVEHRIASLVDDAHGAVPELAHDLVSSYRGRRGQRHHPAGRFWHTTRRLPRW